MKTTDRSTENAKMVEFEAIEGRSPITVAKFKEFMGGWKKTQINWPSLGGVSINEAETFAKALLEAVEAAKKIEGSEK